MKKTVGLSGFALKRIAVASMIVDHVGSIVLRAMMAPYMTGGTLTVNGDSPALLWHLMKAREVCEVLGSIAFPLFCFLMAEGFLHSRDRMGYGLRMGVFALLSEVPFDLAHYGRPLDLRLQNVMFTLTVSIFTLLLIAKAEDRWAEQRAARGGAVALLTLAGAGAAYLFRGEYVFLGVFAVVLFYLLRDKGRLRALGLVPLLVASPWVLLAVPLMLLYSGERGKGSKWFFYCFYPLHFLALAAVAAAILGKI